MPEWFTVFCILMACFILIGICIVDVELACAVFKGIAERIKTQIKNRKDD